MNHEDDYDEGSELVEMPETYDEAVLHNMRATNINAKKASKNFRERFRNAVRRI